MPRAATRTARVASGGGAPARSSGRPRAEARRAHAAPAPAAPRHRRGARAEPLRRRHASAPRPNRAPVLSRSANGVLDRLLRGRVWVACIGILLVGIVFLNVSLLGLNSGIAVTADQAADLRRENAELRLDVARLGATDRIQRVAESRGFVMPGPADVEYVDAEPDGSGERAARALANLGAALPAEPLPTAGTAPAPAEAAPATAAPTAPPPVAGAPPEPPAPAG